MLVDVTVLALVTVATRLPFLLGPTADKATQLYLIEVYAADRRLHPLKFPNSLVQGTLCYPPLPFFFLAYLPLRFRAAVGIALNFLADVAHVLVVYLVLQLLLRGDLAGEGLALGFALLFATLPILHPINARLSSIGGRTLGPLLFTLYGLSLFAAWHAGDTAYLFASIGVGILIVLTSQFALQAVIGSSLFLALWYASLVPILVAGVFLLIGLAIPPLGVRAQLSAKLSHLHWYYRAKNLHIDGRNSFRAARRIASNGAPQAMTKLVVYVLSSVTPVIVTFGIGSLGILAVVSWSGAPTPGETLAIYSAGVGVSGLLLCILTMIGPGKIVGEAERYVEYAAPFLVFTVASQYAHAGGSVATPLILALANVGIVVVQWVILVQDAFRNALAFRPPPDLAEVVRHLDVRPGRRVVASPLSLASALTLHSAGGHQFLQVLIGERAAPFRHWEEDLAGYPHLRGRADHFVHRYSADTMVVERKSLAAIRRLDCHSDLEHLPVEFQNDTYLVLELPGAAG